MSLEAEVSGADDTTQKLADVIPGHEIPIDDQLFRRDCRSLLQVALSAELQPKERDIIQKRFGMIAGAEKGKQWTLEKLGSEYGVTRECIRQAEKRALAKLKSAFIHHQMVD
jgi:RNA polymerase sigma factor (sigma-70 family)